MKRILLLSILWIAPANAETLCTIGEPCVDIGTDTGTIGNAVSETITALDYVKAAAVIEWRAKDETGNIKTAMEHGAELLRTCARQRESAIMQLTIRCP